MSKVEAASTPAATQAGTPPTSTSIELSPAKSTKRVRSRSSDGEGTMTVTLLTNGSAYSNPFFVKDVTEPLLLLVDRRD